MFQTEAAEEIKTLFMFSNLFPENRTLYEIMLGGGGGTRYGQTGHVRFTCWIPKVTNIHSEYVILVAFPPQEWLQERASMLRYT